MKKLSEVKEKCNLNEYKQFEKTIGFSVSYRIFRILYLSWEDRKKYTVTEIENLYLKKNYYSVESRKEFYNLILLAMFTKFFELKLNYETYSSSESGVDKLELDLVAILWNNGLISRDLVYEIYNRNNKFYEIKKRLQTLQIVPREFNI